MDIPKYLESRGWKRDYECDDVDYIKKEWDIMLCPHELVLISRDEMDTLFEGKLLTEEKADIIMESLGIT